METALEAIATEQIKIFGWRVLHGCIPCFVMLANKHIMNSGTCPMCQSEAEDVRHALFACSRADRFGVH
jgi:hypothetical protein